MGNNKLRIQNEQSKKDINECAKQNVQHKMLGAQFTAQNVHKMYANSAGLARYRVHTTATWDQFWNIIEKVKNHSDGVFLVYP